MSRYDIYKPSGIDWIGEIPKHFNLRRFKNEFSYVKGKNPKETFFLDEANGRDIDMPYLSMEYLRNENAEPEFPDKNEKLVSVKDNETLLLWDGSNAGEFIKSKKGYLSSTMVRIDYNKRINSRYAFYIFQSYERILRDLTNGMGIPHVNGVLLNNTYFPITNNESEQLAIANYLDDQTQKIDRLIANKKAQIEKLQELRKIKIYEAVTGKIKVNGYE
jgi:type I restriction enzyme S subunit